MGLKGYRLWVMGQLDSNVQSPTEEPPLLDVEEVVTLAVAAHKLTHLKRKC
jgi:hypothetical protein